MSIDPPALKLIKYPNLGAKIIKAYEAGAPLAPAWFDSPDFYQALIAYKSPTLEKALRYYGLLDPKEKPIKAPNKLNFALHKSEFKPVDVQELFYRLNLMVQKRGIEVVLTPEQLAILRPNFNHYVTWHGNQFLTGAPFLHGGVPHIDFFQWGNLFGVIKYIELEEEKASVTNLLVYFEDLADRTFEECVAQYRKTEQELIEKIFPEAIIVVSEFIPKLMPR